MSQQARDKLVSYLKQREDKGEKSVWIEPAILARVRQQQGDTGRERQSTASPGNWREKVAQNDPPTGLSQGQPETKDFPEPQERPRPSRTLSLSALKEELGRDDQPAPKTPARRMRNAPNQPAPPPEPQRDFTGVEDFFELGKIPGSPDDPRVAALRDIFEGVKKYRAEHPIETLRETMVFAVGNPRADLMLVGEAPGADEEKQREPFVGRAGQLLTKMLKAMGLQRQDVYISNIVKYRPRVPGGKESGNRKPSEEEIAAYRQFVLKEIEVIRPKAIVALGSTSAEGLLDLTGTMGEIHGKWYELKEASTPVMVTYHPSYLLYQASNQNKRMVWEDLLLVMRKLGMEINEKQQNYFL
jgi:DNA polymerase